MTHAQNAQSGAQKGFWRESILKLNKRQKTEKVHKNLIF